MVHASKDLVVIVEDDEAVRNSTRALAEALGFEVLDFPNAEDFLAADLKRRAMCLVLDFRLPKMNGLALLEQIRARGEDTPALFVSADEDGLEARAKKAGAVAVLRKPLSADELAARLEDMKSAGSAQR